MSSIGRVPPSLEIPKNFTQKDLFASIVIAIINAPNHPDPEAELSKLFPNTNIPRVDPSLLKNKVIVDGVKHILKSSIKIKHLEGKIKEIQALLNGPSKIKAQLGEILRDTENILKIEKENYTSDSLIFTELCTVLKDRLNNN